MPGLTGRISAAMHTLDDRAGLGLKAYLMRRNGIDGSPVNQYTCCYLWQDTSAMAEFLCTDRDRFQNIIRFFGRPEVRHWTGIATVAGPARDADPKAATRLLTEVPAEFDQNGLSLNRRIEQEIADLEALSGNENLHTAALAIDPHHWQLLRFALWRDTAPESGDRYQVGHLSKPGIDTLPEGRHW